MVIIAHHYVNASGMQACDYTYKTITGNIIFLQIWGMGGKFAINAFVLVTGWFMCTRKVESLDIKRKWLKLYFEIIFYSFSIFIILFILGYQKITPNELYKLFFGIITYSVGSGFSGSFLIFYLFIPYYNILLEKLDKKMLQKLLILLLMMYTIFSTFFFNNQVFNAVGWYMTLYFAAAYIRLYPSGWMSNNKLLGAGLIVVWLLSVLSILVVDFVGSRFGFGVYWWMVVDSNKLFAFMLGMLIFLWFKNLQLKYNKFINIIASTTFGILLIHASSDAMRTMLWEDIFDVPRICRTVSVGRLAGHAIITMIIVFCTCSIIELLRIKIFRFVIRTKK